MRPSPTLRRLLLLLAGLAFAPVATLPLLAQRAAIQATHTISEISLATDAGPLPTSQPLTLTLRLAPSPAQRADLDHLLASQVNPASPDFHHWLTPAQFADRFGVPDDRLAELTTWLQTQGLTVVAIAPSRTRLTITGPTAAAQAAFATTLHRVNRFGTLAFANTSTPTLPQTLAPLVASVSGLDDLPSTAIITLSTTPTVRTRALNLADPAATAAPATAATTSTLDTLAATIDANITPILTLSSAACSPEIPPADQATYEALFQQANAQGITLLTTAACPSSATNPSFPASLPEITALTLIPPDLTTASPGTTMRPVWQAAPGLPPDAERHAPDLTTTSAADFATALTTILQQSGTRQGNINPTLYALAPTPGLYTQPSDPAPASNETETAGNWQPATGLGTVDLQKLIKVFPRGLNSTTTSLVSSIYAISYGNTFTLTSQVLPTTYGATLPTGTMTFTSSQQGVIGTATVTNGTATLTAGVLPVGTYSLTATYTGDTIYAGSASTSNVTITVSIVNANILATVSPTTQVPYGATATVTATVTLPGTSAAPSGAVSAQVQGVTGAYYSATLSPNPGNNSATANITVSVPAPGTYTISVTCAGNSGNGTGAYVYSGSVSFYDSGKLIGIAPVATNQATTTLALSGNRTHNITATYTGDTNWSGSTSGAVAVIPTILPSALNLTSSVTNPNGALAGLNVVLTGTVSTTITYNSGPTGTVTFYDTFNGGFVQLGSPATLISNGPNAAIGLFNSTGLLAGTHSIYAVYSGDDNYASATSAVLVLKLSDFSLSMTPSVLSLTQGKSAQASGTVADFGGFTGTVSFGCTPPAGSEATCNFSPASVTGGGATTLTIVTTAPRTGASQHQAVLRWAPATGATLATLLFFVLPRRRPLTALLLLLLAAGVTANLGCGDATTSINSTTTTSTSTTGTAPADPGTPLGTQNFTITASGTDGTNTVRHTYQYQVTVQ